MVVGEPVGFGCVGWWWWLVLVNVLGEDGRGVRNGEEGEEVFIEERRSLMRVLMRRDGKSEELVLSSSLGSISCRTTRWFGWCLHGVINIELVTLFLLFVPPA